MTLPPAPVGTAGVPSVPHGRTARRLGWKFLPADLRALIEGELGGSVVDAVSQDGGFTPGFASVLTTASGARSFVKAANRAAQPEIAASYAEEGRKHAVLDGSVPAPRLEWVHEDGGWVVLGFEAVAAHPPRRPWRPQELLRALDLAESIADAVREVPTELDLKPLVVDVPKLVTGWHSVPAEWPHRDEAASLTARLPMVPDSLHFCHCDLRDDNILFADDGRTLACDWNWPALGPVWQDTVDLLISAHGDGIDVASSFGDRPLTRDADPDDIDAWIAAICGFMLSARDPPAPPSSPHVRTHSDWYAEAAWSLLAQRRGWA